MRTQTDQALIDDQAKEIYKLRTTRVSQGHRIMALENALEAAIEGLEGERTVEPLELREVLRGEK